VKRSIHVKVAAAGPQSTSANVGTKIGITCPDVQTGSRVDVVWRP
jgi:hypothetical protein